MSEQQIAQIGWIAWTIGVALVWSACVGKKLRDEKAGPTALVFSIFAATALGAFFGYILGWVWVLLYLRAGLWEVPA